MIGILTEMVTVRVMMNIRHPTLLLVTSDTHRDVKRVIEDLTTIFQSLYERISIVLRLLLIMMVVQGYFIRDLFVFDRLVE